MSQNGPSALLEVQHQFTHDCEPSTALCLEHSAVTDNLANQKNNIKPSTSVLIGFTLFCLSIYSLSLSNF